MSDTVFILGAGASKLAGVPLMNEFLDVADDLQKKGKIKNNAKSFDLVQQARGKLLSINSKARLDLNNIESIFTAFDMAKTLNKFPGISTNNQLTDDIIEEYLKATKLLIVNTIENTLHFPVNRGRIQSPNPYDSFIGLIKYLMHEASPKHTISIITFNYDIAIDFALYKNNISANYFVDNFVHSEGISLLKLHGSLNWAQDLNSKQVDVWRFDNYFQSKNFDIDHRSSDFININITDDYGEKFSDDFIRIPIGTEITSFKSERLNNGGSGPVIIPPTWNKSYYHSAIAQAWIQAAKELTDAENIFIIGYSFPPSDSFFYYLYSLGTAGEIPFKRLWIFNPNSTGIVEKRFAEILGPAAEVRFQYNKLSFEGAIRYLGGQFGKKEPTVGIVG
jgi:hypothetical protein